MVELWGIMGNYGTIIVDVWRIMGNYGIFWGIMGFYRELCGFMSGLLPMLVSFLFLLCSFPQTCQIQIFMLSIMSCTFVCHMCTNPPREYLS